MKAARALAGLRGDDDGRWPRAGVTRDHHGGVTGAVEARRSGVAGAGGGRLAWLGDRVGARLAQGYAPLAGVAE